MSASDPSRTLAVEFGESGILFIADSGNDRTGPSSRSEQLNLYPPAQRATVVPVQPFGQRQHREEGYRCLPGQTDVADAVYRERHRRLRKRGCSGFLRASQSSSWPDDCDRAEPGRVPGRRWRQLPLPDQPFPAAGCASIAGPFLRAGAHGGPAAGSSWSS